MGEAKRRRQQDPDYGNAKTRDLFLELLQTNILDNSISVGEYGTAYYPNPGNGITFRFATRILKVENNICFGQLLSTPSRISTFFIKDFYKRGHYNSMMALEEQIKVFEKDTANLFCKPKIDKNIDYISSENYFFNPHDGFKEIFDCDLFTQLSGMRFKVKDSEIYFVEKTKKEEAPYWIPFRCSEKYQHDKTQKLMDVMSEDLRNIENAYYTFVSLQFNQNLNTSGWYCLKFDSVNK